MRTATRQDEEKAAWDGMDEEGRKLITSVMDIKKQCLVLIEDQFTQQFHDVGDELYDLVERCEGDDPYTGVSGGKEIAKLIIGICEKYLPERIEISADQYLPDHMFPRNDEGTIGWGTMLICGELKLGEKRGGLPLNERIDIGNNTIKKLTQLVGALEKVAEG